MSHKKRKKPRPVPKTGGSEALQRTADLVRKIVSVPKSELATDARKDAKRKHD